MYTTYLSVLQTSSQLPILLPDWATWGQDHTFCFFCPPLSRPHLVTDSFLQCPQEIALPFAFTVLHTCLYLHKPSQNLYFCYSLCHKTVKWLIQNVSSFPTVSVCAVHVWLVLFWTLSESWLWTRLSRTCGRRVLCQLSHHLPSPFRMLP